MAQGDLVLLTGGTGFIGFRTLRHLIEAGYSVRCAVRSQSKADTVVSTLKSFNLDTSNVTFTDVQDLTASGAYDEAVKGVKYVIHVASPIPSQHNPDSYNEAEKVFIKPAKEGALELLRAAKKAGTVVRVVITSSTVAIMPPAVWGGRQKPEKAYGPDSRAEDQPGPYENPSQAYCSSKIAQLNAIEKWIDEEKPGFDTVLVHPSWVMGKAELCSSAEEITKGTNKYACMMVEGEKIDLPKPGASVDVDDVAKVQVLALDPKIKVDEQKKRRSLITSSPMKWEDIPRLVERDFPSAVQKKLVPNDGKQPTMPIEIDGSETEQVLGIKFKSFEEQMHSLFGQYLSLKAAA